MSIEHPESSRAVEETEGEVAVYDGELINALYTSTCGGATENVEEIFEGGAVPYLRSTECVLEGDRSVTLKTERRLPAHFENGENVAVKMAVPAASRRFHSGRRSGLVSGSAPGGGSGGMDRPGGRDRADENPNPVPPPKSSDL